jgi:hypothetical protein
MVKFKFPAITPLRLVFVAIGISFCTPVAWSLWWLPLARKISPMPDWLFTPVTWQIWPLILFPAGFALATYAMYRHGMTKQK